VARFRVRWDPRSWASLVPNGIGHQKPNHYAEMLKTIWENRGQLPYAWRILTRGVCDGCALGTSGLKDWTMSGPHLCTVRLNLLKLNTMGPLDPTLLRDVSRLAGRSGEELRALGRLPEPMVRHRGEPGFTTISWDVALDLIANRIRRSAPERIAFWMTSRGITNEAYYVTQKVARFLGTNNVDNAARICHSPSTVAMRRALGVAASTCSYADWIGTDLIVLVGSHIANNQPVATKYLYLAKKAGARVAVVNPYREPGLARYWVPSAVESALFGTRLADRFFAVTAGGDIAFFNGVLKHLVEIGAVDRPFIEQHTAGWPELEAALAAQGWAELESFSGTTREEMQAFAELYAAARSAVFVWSMGVTQHRHGVENVLSILNVALARGMVGREYCGLMPIRGHSGVQGGAEMGAVPGELPGGVPVGSDSARRLEERWGFPVPQQKGMQTVQMLEEAYAGELELLYCIGGNFTETLPDPDRVRTALSRVPLRVHQDIVLSSAMLEEPGETVLILPAQTRYEQAGGTCQTTTERRVIFNPEIPGPRIPHARPEWEIPMQVAERAQPDRAGLIHFESTAAIRHEIARAYPTYDGIQRLSRQGDQFQWGGRLLCAGGRFPTGDDRARFHAVAPPPEAIVPAGCFFLSTRRGKQFNSMVGARKDPLTGARRDDVLMCEADARELGVREGARIRLVSETGSFDGRVRFAAIRQGNLQVHWPEGNRLIPAGRLDPVSGVPDYNAVVRVELKE
jgi:molybdopterin-dependent oxidoreductase alpha subunit